MIHGVPHCFLDELRILLFADGVTDRIFLVGIQHHNNSETVVIGGDRFAFAGHGLLIVQLDIPSVQAPQIHRC